MPPKINDGLTKYQRYILNSEKRNHRNEHLKMWRQTDKGKFTRNRNHWISGGIKEPNEGWENFWEVFKKKTNCELCGIDFDLDNGATSTRGRCLDHHHHSGTIRNIICRGCNTSTMRKHDSKHDMVLFQLQRYFRNTRFLYNKKIYIIQYKWKSLLQKLFLLETQKKTI